MRLHNNHSKARTKTSTVTPKFVLIFFFLSDFPTFCHCRTDDLTELHIIHLNADVFVCFAVRCDRPTDSVYLQVNRRTIENEREIFSPSRCLPFLFFIVIVVASRIVFLFLLWSIFKFIMPTKPNHPSIRLSVVRPSICECSSPFGAALFRWFVALVTQKNSFSKSLSWPWTHKPTLHDSATHGCKKT